MSTIKIKKSKQGSLHKHLGVPKGKKIPASKLRIKSTDSPAIRKKKQFAINARKWRHEYGGLVPEYSWGGVLADTAAGAGMGALSGSAVPGIGTAIGAAIGGAGAFLKGAVGEIMGNRAEQAELAKQRVDNANMAFNTMMGAGIQNPFTPTFALGGKVGLVNAEIEKGETAVSPDGTMYEYSLPPHANAMGDNFKYFDPGTMIFSDKLKFNKHRTFAQEQNRYKKVSDKADKTLSNTGSTFLQKATAKLNKKNALKMSVDLFGKQEAMKMSKGGKIPGKFPGGGITGDPRYPWPESTFNAMTYGVRPGTYVNPYQLGEIPVLGHRTPQLNINSPFPVNLGYSGFGTSGYPWPQRAKYTPEPDYLSPYDWATGRGSSLRPGEPHMSYTSNNFLSKPITQSPYLEIAAAQPIVRGQSPVGITTTASSGGTGATATKGSIPSLKMANFNRAFAPKNAPFYDTTPAMASLYQYGTSGFKPGGDISGNLAAVSPANPSAADIKQHLKEHGVGPDWGSIGMQALALAPDIYNLGHALFSKPERIERTRYFNPYTNQIRSRMNDRRFNIDPILAANRAANAIYNRNVSNAAGGDRSRLLSNLLAGMTGRQAADASAYANKINMDNQYLAEQAQMDYTLGAMNANALALRDDINARNAAAYRNFGAAAASGLQNYALNQMQMDNQLASQRAYLNVLERSNPFFNQWLNLDLLKSYGKYNRE